MRISTACDKLGAYELADAFDAVIVKLSQAMQPNMRDTYNNLALKYNDLLKKYNELVQQVQSGLVDESPQTSNQGTNEYPAETL